MIFVKREDGVPKPAQRHTLQCGTTKLAPEQGTVRLHCSVSHFLPGGGTETYASPAEKAFYGLSGTLLVIAKGGKEYAVRAGDMLYVAPGEERTIRVCGNEPATILVMIVNAD